MKHLMDKMKHMHPDMMMPAGPKDEKEAKLMILKELRDEMSNLMKHSEMSPEEHMVKVAADSKEGLEEGLDKAKDVLHELPAQDEGNMPTDEEQEEEDKMHEIHQNLKNENDDESEYDDEDDEY